MSDNALLKRFMGKAGLALLLRVIWAVVNYLGVVLLARWFTPAEYGYYAVIISVVMFLGIVSAVGSQTTTLRFMGEYRAHDQFARIQGLARYAVRVVAGVSGAVMLLAIAAVWIGYAAGWVQNPIVFSIGLLLLPGFAVHDSQSGVARSFGSVFAALAPRDVLWRAGIIGLGYLATYGMDEGIRLPLFLLSAAILLSGLIVWQIWYSRRLLPAEALAADPEMDIPAWRRVAAPIWLSNIANVSLRTWDVILVGAILGAEITGYYFAASRTAALTGFVLLSVNLITGPMISKSFHSGATMRLRKVLALSAALAFPFAAIMTAIFAIWGRDILAIFGEAVVDFAPVLLVLALGHAASAFFGSCGLMLDLSGHERANMRILFATTALMLGAMVFGGMWFGALGVAWAVAGGQAAANLWRWVYLRMQTGHDSSIMALRYFL